MGYTTLYQGSASNSRTAVMDLFIYPNAAKMDTLSENFYADALNSAAQQILSRDAIAAYNIKISYEHPNRGGARMEDVHPNWVSYDGPNNKLSRSGVHVLTVDLPDGALAESKDGNRKFGWEESAAATVGYWEFDRPYYRNATIQEPGHCFIDSDNFNIVPYMGGGTNEEGEHSLGSRINHKVTPMGTGYPSLQTEGACKSTDSRSGKTTTLTFYTKDAYFYSAENSEW